MSLYPVTQSYFFSNDPNSGARQVSADGSRFTVQLDSPIEVPEDAIGASLSVSQATIWNVSYNISASISNNIFKFTTNEAPAGTYTLTIPDGQYSLPDLNSHLSREFVNLGLPNNLVVISGDSATQRTILTFIRGDDSVDFAVASSVRETLGFDSRVVTSQGTGWNEFSDNQAAFNRVNSYIITTDLISNGIPTNSVSSGVIASVPIDVGPGSQITYQPRNPISTDAGELVRHRKNVFTFNLYDQQLRPVDTNGELWSFVVVLKYYLEHKK